MVDIEGIIERMELWIEGIGQMAKLKSFYTEDLNPAIEVRIRLALPDTGGY